MITAFDKKRVDVIDVPLTTLTGHCGLLVFQSPTAGGIVELPLLTQ
jgi:hypothetical protein